MEGLDAAAQAAQHAVQSSAAKFGKVAAQDAVHGAARGVQSAVAKFSKGMQGCCVKQPAYRIDIQNCCAKGFALFCLMGRHKYVCVVPVVPHKAVAEVSKMGNL